MGLREFNIFIFINRLIPTCFWLYVACVYCLLLQYIIEMCSKFVFYDVFCYWLKTVKLFVMSSLILCLNFTPFRFEVVEYVFLMPPPTWVANHNYSHHVYTNLLSDYDVSTPYPALVCYTWVYIYSINIALVLFI